MGALAIRSHTQFQDPKGRDSNKEKNSGEEKSVKVNGKVYMILGAVTESLRCARLCWVISLKESLIQTDHRETKVI